ncbi:MAG: aminoacyl-tRNA hydrolase [Parcubacteria group bacterium]|nr:aminoacyl-tRNA hydrolase [Parcubacteria group bacterium]
MILIVGLGNPGRRFAHTRHSLGSQIVRATARLLTPAVRRREATWQGDVTYVPNDTRPRVVCVIPVGTYFMNESGTYVRALVHAFALSPENLWVVHDDTDLRLGELRVVLGRGAAGHRGVQSIIDALHTNQFVRFRVGVASGELETQSTDVFVLERFTTLERPLVRKSITRVRDAILFALHHDIPATMNVWNAREVSGK